MIKAIVQNLERGIQLLNSISDQQYSDKTVPPYHSSIGSNMRHVLDAFTSIFNGIDTRDIDFSDRKRNTICEEKTLDGINYFNEIIIKLNKLSSQDLKKKVAVTDNLGTGEITIDYTIENALAYAHSHAIHHFASIGFLVNKLEIELQDADFGYNPTTPKTPNLQV